MLRGEQRYYNDSEVLHYQTELRSSSSSSSSASATFRNTEDGYFRELEGGGTLRILDSSSSSSSASQSSSSFSTPFRYQDSGDDLCTVAHNI